ncbi:hypothetical protein KKG46_01190 [Patescibacteria group bacterium]|nr:hypothetical protein [Patescibacteria group bacterium]
MSGYISESFRFLELAQNNFKNFSDNKDSFTCIIFSAFYIEGVINDIIFHDQLLNQQYKEFFAKKEKPLFQKILNFIKGPFIKDEYHDFDLYNERKSFENKTRLIFEKYKNDNFRDDKEYIELKHLFLIRGFLAHLKPIKQDDEGHPEIKICKSALNYLHKNLKIIDDPFARGVFWTDVIMKKEVAEWAIQVAKNSVEYLYNKTFKAPLGNSILDFHCLRLSIGKYKKHST